MTSIKIKSETNPHWYGDTVEFNDGTLCINMFDGTTHLSKEEAKQLVDALNKYINEQETPPYK